MTTLKLAAIGFSLILFSCGQADNDKDASNKQTADSAGTNEQGSSISQAKMSTEKSIHLFDMPDGVTEAEWSASINEMNAVIAKIGYPNAGYAFYKVESDSVKTNRYYFEGVWPTGDGYKTIHENPEFIKSTDKFAPLYDKIKAVEIYRRVRLVQ